MDRTPDTTRAVALAVGLAVGWVAVALVAFAGARALIAGGDYRVPALVAIAMLSGLLALGLTVFGLWRRIGFIPRSEWREGGLLIVPALLVLLPLVAGLGPTGAALSGVLVFGYALTGFAEEAFFRGVILDVLRPLGPVRSAALSALLFGAVHLANIAIRGNPAVILAQAVGAACFGFGYAALRQRTGALVPLMVLHGLTDLFLPLGALPLIPVAALQDVALLGFGIVLLARAPGRALW